jgi:hypothetical protein
MPAVVEHDRGHRVELVLRVGAGAEHPRLLVDAEVLAQLLDAREPLAVVERGRFADRLQRPRRAHDAAP